MIPRTLEEALRKWEVRDALRQISHAPQKWKIRETVCKIKDSVRMIWDSLRRPFSRKRKAADKMKYSLRSILRQRYLEALRAEQVNRISFLATVVIPACDPVFEAVERQNLGLMKKLLRESHGANVNVTSPVHGAATPLNLASRLGYVHMVKELLSIPGVDVSACDSYGDSPLFSAVREGHVEVARVLIMDRRNYRMTNACGLTPLQAAVTVGRPEMVQMLSDLHTQNVIQGILGSVSWIDIVKGRQMWESFAHVPLC